MQRFTRCAALQHPAVRIAFSCAGIFVESTSTVCAVGQLVQYLYDDAAASEGLAITSVCGLPNGGFGGVRLLPPIVAQ